MTAIAVVIVAYESARHLPQTLAALRSQLGDDDELLIVDNASSDAPATVVGDTRLVRLESNVGFAGGCNVGAASTSAPLLFFLNPDAHPATGCLDELRAAAAAHPDWGAWQALVLLPGGHHVNSRGGEVHWLGVGWSGGYGEPVEEVPTEDRSVGFASGAALVVRRHAWDAAGGFDPNYFMYGEDVDLSLRLRLAGWEIGLARDAHVEHDYEFTKGESKWFRLERNRWATVVSAYPWPLLARLLPALLLAEFAFVAVAARGGWLRAKLRAEGAVLRRLPATLRRRAVVQASTRISPREFARALTASLDSPFLGPAARLRPLGAAQAAYWRFVRAALP